MSESKRSEWARRVERWKSSGLSAKEFAAQAGLNASTLAYWNWKLGTAAVSGGKGAEVSSGHSQRRRLGRTIGTQTAGFVELLASAVTASSAALELVLNRGVRVRVPSGFDEATLTRIVRAVEAAQ